MLETLEEIYSSLPLIKEIIKTEYERIENELEIEEERNEEIEEEEEELVLIIDEKCIDYALLTYFYYFY